jgi:endonuclease/exonuclease/phosphatase (EEP) superfamily protein YafD
VVNIHAINFVGVNKFSRQVAQVVDLIVGHEGPLVLAGDFNTWNPRRKKILAKAAESLGLNRVPVAARRLRHLNQVLDHVFYRGLELLASRPLRHIKSSDHVPLWAEFRLA